MSYLLTIIAFVVIFSVLVLIHELGHFMMAKRAGIKVEEFGFGLPPRIWGKKKGETIYSINWIPFGGFVRLFGEDASDPKVLKNSRSFASKSVRDRVLVIIAGVVMNFLLAWFLLGVGFMVGMQPIVLPDKVFDAINDGTIMVDEGLLVKSVVAGSEAEKDGFLEGDKIYLVNDENVSFDVLKNLKQDELNILKVIRNGESVDLTVNYADNLGLEFGEATVFPRLRILSLTEGIYKRADLAAGDFLIAVNGKQIFSLEDYQKETSVLGGDTLKYKIYRDGQIWERDVPAHAQGKVFVEEVLPDSPAGVAGLMPNDVILSLNGKSVHSGQQLINLSKAERGNHLQYDIQRGTDVLSFKIEPKDGKIGVLLSDLLNYRDGSGITLYGSELMTSLIEVKEQRLPLLQSFGRAFSEMMAISKVTAVMFADFVRDVFTRASVPDSVAGPVGIFQMTHISVQQGLIPLLRFAALLSLSLAVINILPIPALDGGRLLFIIFEVILGRKVNQKWEAIIHTIGYGLILLLILAVTYSDIVRLFV